MGSEEGRNISTFLKQLAQIQFGEHNILVYDDIASFRQIYSNHAKKRLEGNEIVLLLPYFESVDSVKFYLQEAGVDVEQLSRDGSLVIVDSVEQFFGEGKDFLYFLGILEKKAKENGKEGISVIADMNAFYQIYDESRLIKYETSIQPKTDAKYSSLLCSYQRTNFDRLAKSARELILAQHYRKLI
jgi:DcmR-like sensory protein